MGRNLCFESRESGSRLQLRVVRGKLCCRFHIGGGSFCVAQSGLDRCAQTQKRYLLLQLFWFRHTANRGRGLGVAVCFSELKDLFQRRLARPGTGLGLCGTKAGPKNPAKP